MVKPLRSSREFSLHDLLCQKKHHHCISSGMQVMKSRLGNVRMTTQVPLCYIEKVDHTLSYTCNKIPTLTLNKEKEKLYLHLPPVSDVLELEYFLKITAFCLFSRTQVSLLRLKSNPGITNIIIIGLITVPNRQHLFKSMVYAT